MPKLLILSSLPGDERDRYAQLLKSEYEIISRDLVRNSLFGKDCYITNKIEDEVTREFDFRLQKSYLCGLNILINSTNCNENYIDKIIAECPAEYEIELKFFNISLATAYWNNFWNSILNGQKFVPYHILRKMKKNFDNINKSKYKQYAQITTP